jgi:hypothetical protein
MFRASRPLVCFASSVSLVTFVSFVRPSEARGQTTDVVGVRAQGMGGAFTAVADDATATWWNPAGLAGGAYFNAIVELGTHQAPRTDPAPAFGPVPAWRTKARSVSVAFPALGLSYYRLRLSEIRPEISTGTDRGVRQDQGMTGVRLRSLVLNQIGATVGQSVGEHLVLGSTLKLVRASLGAEVRAPGAASLDEAERLPADGETHSGLDIGAMAVFGRTRLGLTVRNVTEPEFGTGLDAITLRRQARAGVALSSGTRGVIGSATVAVDADLTRTATALGDERRAAAGVEVWTPKRSVGVRGGLSANTLGDRRSSFSGGLSAALRRGTYVEGEATGGADDSRRGWSLGLRVTF